MSNFRFVLRLAWREAHAARRRLILLTASVTAGVAALVAVNSFTDNLQVSVTEQAQALLGADLSIGSSRINIDSAATVTAFIDSLRTLGGPEVEIASSTSLAAMAYVASSGTARLVQLRSIDRGFPYYGTIETKPAGVWSAIQDGGVVVDPALLPAIGAEIGDTLLVGEGRFPILGTVVNVPGDVGLQAAFGSRIFVATSRLAETELLGFGSRVERETFIKLPATIDAQAVAAANRPGFRPERIRLRTIVDEGDNLSENLTRLTDYLGLVALIALLLGGLGTASAVTVFIRQKLDTIAVLRCLGATSGQLVGIHLLQAVGMGLLGALIGAALGVALQQLMPLVLAGMLPVDVRVLPSGRAIVLGIALGVWTATVFALLPLLGIREISPLATLRRATTPPRARWDLPRLIAVVLLVASIVGLAGVQVGSIRQGVWFAVAIGVALLLLWLASLAVIRGARRFVPASWPYLSRQGLANLHRPGNQTVTVVLVLGFGAFLLTTLFTAQHNLLRGFAVDTDPNRANLVLIDIQPDQRDLIAEVLSQEESEGTALVPLVNMRIAAVNGRPTAELLGDTPAPDDSTGSAGGPGGGRQQGGGGSRWVLRREYRSTYRAEVGNSERVTAGSWFPEGTGGSGRTAEDPVAISVEDGVAADLGVGIGDRLTWDVQGVEIHSEVTSLREVNWARLEPNFFVVFAPGALETAPHTLITLARVSDPVARGRIQRALAERASNVSSIDLGEIQQALERVIGRIVLAIRFMALFSLATGAVVLIGAIATSRWQRIREGTLLRTLGATRAQVLRILMVEYAALGLAASLVASALAGVAGWLLATRVFNATFVLPVFPLLALTVALVSLTMVVGLWSSLDVLERPPLEVLRAE
ncbi:MAG: FtsX-like permease family protein [Gemmatimonadales bacterium]|nr:FtsX-like permease family protein [Gemmatimonadales bacterium]MDZ4389940.1 FtsX-like permease family protein [Gemmatimonadales bacterium]